jgi:hypothetical protein
MNIAAADSVEADPLAGKFAQHGLAYAQIYARMRFFESRLR